MLRIVCILLLFFPICSIHIMNTMYILYTCLLITDRKTGNHSTYLLCLYLSWIGSTLLTLEISIKLLNSPLYYLQNACWSSSEGFLHKREYGFQISAPTLPHHLGTILSNTPLLPFQTFLTVIPTQLLQITTNLEKEVGVGLWRCFALFRGSVLVFCCCCFCFLSIYETWRRRKKFIMKVQIIWRTSFKSLFNVTQLALYN